MTDPDDEKTAIDAPPKSPKVPEEASLQPELIAMELQRSEGDRDLEIFRTLINIKIRLENPENSAIWNHVFVELLQIIVASDDVGEEQVLLASLALVNVLYRSCRFEDFTHQLRTYWNLEDPLLKAFGKDFQIHDLEWFKLVVTHGYLQVNIRTIYAREIISLPFEVLRRNCLIYTKYSYFAYKTLQTWLDKTAKTDFWWGNNAAATEKALEAIIFSNWDSCICEIARRNSTQIFPTYLRVMSEKYEGFLNHVFEKCMQNLSWQNVLKYTILAEVCKLWDDLPKIVSSDLPSCLFTSLTKNHLKHPGTKLYLTVLEKLKANEWEEIFGECFFRISAIWESGEQVTAIELLWEQWMTPTIMRFGNVFEFLWKHESMNKLKLSRSYLERIGDRQGFQLMYEDSEFRDILNGRVIDISESVRLNAFAIICQLKNWKVAVNESDPFTAMKRFLYFNIDTSSITMRKSIVKNFDILFANIVRLADKDPEAERHIRDFLHWLHEFLLDCFEWGACYQRKILALSLYEIVLILTSFGDCRMGRWNADKSRGERRKLITCATNLREKINGTKSWLYCDLKSARTLFALVYDQVDEVREKASFILLQYFSSDVFPPGECEYCWNMNYKYYESSQFDKVAIGATVEKMRTLWDQKFEPPLYNDRPSTVLDHVGRARSQLSKMQRGFRDILYCLVNGSPVYGSLTVILEVGFLIGPVERIYDESTIQNILDLVEDVTNFFLKALSAKAETGKYSSSFAEMGLAIEEKIKISQFNEDHEECILTSAHQLLLSCIWMSLKVSCEIAAEIGLIAETEEIARRAVDLIVSVLLKCRHKGAIEAAGLALAKLTKSLSKGNYNGLIESHLTNLLNIDDEDNINLTRRGAGLSIMFYRIVSNDDRRNRPWLHLAVQKLLDSLKISYGFAEYAWIQSDDCLIDSPRARHLHFLRSLVADKALQTQLVPYMEDICLTCFKCLQSPEWTMRNASLQLFGAIVPRLVGQCSARELDYGVGNSVEHFFTHYPILAKAVMTRLKSMVDSFCDRKAKNCSFIHTDNEIVPILTLLSKMSSGGCDLIDYQSQDYLKEARKAFVILLEHPVFNIRILASKAYAAFVALPDIPYELTKLQLRSLSAERVKMDNHEHGRFCAQLYLVRKLKHELQSTSNVFFIRKHRNCEDIVSRGSHLQLRLLARTVYRWLRHEEQICYTVATALIRCLLESPVPFSSRDFPLDWTQTHVAVSKFVAERSKPGFAEFLENLMSLSVQLRVVHNIAILSEIFHGRLHCPEHRAATMKNLRSERRNLEIFVDEALAIIDDPKETEILLSVVSSIRDTTNEEIPEELESKIRKLTNELQGISVKSRAYARQLRNFGYCIALKFTKFDRCLLDSTMNYVNEGAFDEDAVTRELAIECLSRLIAVCSDVLRDISTFIRYGGKIFFEAIIVTLMDEDPETRETMAKMLRPVMQIFVENSGAPVCAKASFHRILHRLSLLWVEDSQYCPHLSDDVLQIFERLTRRVRSNVPLKELESPFQQDHTLNRDDTSLLNILFYCVRTLVERISPTGDNESVEVQQIDGAISAKHEFQRLNGLDLWHLEVLFNLNRSHYLSIKKGTLMKIIDKSRCS